jgi:hypothetical protein
MLRKDFFRTAYSFDKIKDVIVHPKQLIKTKYYEKI